MANSSIAAVLCHNLQYCNRKMMKLFVLLLAAVTVNGASVALRGITSVSETYHVLGHCNQYVYYTQPHNHNVSIHHVYTIYYTVWRLRCSCKQLYRSS